MSNETCRIGDWSPEARRALFEVLSRTGMACTDVVAAPIDPAAARLERVVERFEEYLKADCKGLNQDPPNLDWFWARAEEVEAFIEQRRAGK